MPDPSRSEPAWLADLNLDPDAPAVAMGTRALGDRPWLVVDELREAELELKARLCARRHSEVFGAEAGTESASRVVAALIRAEGIELSPESNLHPLDRAGRSVQEDLCLVQRRRDGWHLTAASLCFPSRWRLTDKLGRHVTDVHAPVPGYATRLAARVDSLFDRLDDRPVWRRNWFVHPDPALFQPDRPAGGDPLVPAAACRTGLFLRSERQTLRALDAPDSILFTIRVQQVPLGALLDQRGAAFATWLHDAPPEVVAHKGISGLQTEQIRQALQ